MALYMLGTDIAVCVIRGSSRILTERIASMAPDQLCISAVTRRELRLGLSREASLPVAGRAAKSSAALPAPDPPAIEDLRRATHSVLAALSPREAQALRKRFGLEASTGPTLESVSRRFAITRERSRSGKRSETEDQSRGRSTAIEKFLSRVVCLPWDADAASHFATIAIQAHQIGRALSATQTMVAAHALAVDAVLVTSNKSSFAHVSGLKTENWTRRPASP